MAKKKKTTEALSAEQIHEHLKRVEAGQSLQFLFTAGLGIVAIGLAFSEGLSRWFPVTLGGVLLFIAVCLALPWKRGGE